MRALNATGASRAGEPVGGAIAAGGQRADGRPGQAARRVARRRDPPCRRQSAARALGSAEAAITTLAALDLEAAVEGLILGSYRFTEFRTSKTAPKDSGLRKITVLSTAKDAKAQAAHAAAVATAVATARDFVNTPPSHLFPAEFANRAKALGESVGLEAEVLDDKALQEGWLRRGDRSRQGFVAAATVGAADPSRVEAGQKAEAGQESRPGR